MPPLIGNYQKEALKAELKKSYSELQQINLNFIYNEGMNMCEYDWALVDSGYNVMAASKELSRKFVSYYLGKGEYINNMGISKVKGLTGEIVTHTLFDDGSTADIYKRTYYFEYGTPPDKCPVITVDVNGYYKKPNQLGVDMFAFRPTKKGNVIPLGNPDQVNDGVNGSRDFTQCSKVNYNSTNNGIGCAYWALNDINTDDNTKSYWKNFIK